MAVHICFGYGALVKGRPRDGYSFLAELAETAVQQVSVEAAQSGLDCSVLEQLAGKTIILGVLDLIDRRCRVPTGGGVAHPPRAAFRRARTARHRPGLRTRDLSRASAFGKLESMVSGARIVREELCAAAAASRPAQAHAPYRAQR